MKYKLIRIGFFVMYLMAGLMVSFVLPPLYSCFTGFVFALLAQWAWRVLTRPERTLSADMIDCMREFVGSVYLMRSAQKCYDVVPEGKSLIKKLEAEGRVDEDLEILVSEEVRTEYAKQKEVSNG